MIFGWNLKANQRTVKLAHANIACVFRSQIDFCTKL